MQTVDTFYWARDYLPSRKASMSCTTANKFARVFGSNAVG